MPTVRWLEGVLALTYSFRIRGNRCPTTTIATEESELQIPVDEYGVSVRLRSSQEKPLKESERYVLVGSGYLEEETARAEGVRYQNALMLAFAMSRVGVDFGFRAAKGSFTKPGLEWAEQQFGVRALNDVHGLMVYETEPPARFVSMSAIPTVGANREVFVDNLHRAFQIKPDLSDREVIAFTMFNASFFQPTADTRFILLVMAMEALIGPTKRQDSTVQLVDSLIEKASSSNIEKSDKDSIQGSLNSLKYESIGQAGKRLATERLGSETRYQDLEPRDFFARCYKVRSNLVHGSKPFPTFKEVGALAAPLEVFVSDLLTGPYVSTEN